MALSNAGCMVEAVCPARHPLEKTSAVRRTHSYHGLMPLMSLAKAIRSARPDLIVPGDDLSTHQLHHLYCREKSRGADGVAICALIERSFGAPESFPVVYERATFMRMAGDEGIRTPKTAVVGNLEDLRRLAAEIGFPAVVKADGTSGGVGVRIVQTLEEAESAFRTLQTPPLLARAAKRAIVDHDKTLIWPSLLRRRSVGSVQSWIEGGEATSTVACWQGKVLAELHFEVINKRSSSGPATVMRWIDHPEMSSAVGKMVRRLGLSGLHGFDFMIEARTGNAYLIEINPRTTQVGHLTLGAGRDLPAALCAVLAGSTVEAAPKLTEKDTVVLFPQEWMRDPGSAFLSSGYHDVPWEEPELLRACVQHARKQRTKKSPSNQDAALALVRAPRA